MNDDTAISYVWGARTRPQVPELGFQATRSYSLMRPPRTREPRSGTRRARKAESG
jgi:hypothetical protein